MRKTLIELACFIGLGASTVAFRQSTDSPWGESIAKLKAEDAAKGQLFEDGNYAGDLTYSGEGRLVWGVDVEGGEHIQNQQNSSHNYQRFPIGWINFPNAGRYTVSVSCLEGDIEKAGLKTIHFTPVELQDE